MFPAYLTLTVLLALVTGAGSVLGYTHHPIPVTAAAQVGVPRSWMVYLATALGAGALGLLTGLAFPPLGIAAATGLVLYFLGAVLAHLRVNDYALTQPTALLLLSAATLTTTILYNYP
ncbi:DoxX family protein [Nocardia sp. SSK8]|uniref:DoxX family protein n=1 Tax=Nocardia sp. SSK8 TaxID=3120154 RepID=UPI0030080AE3